MIKKMLTGVAALLLGSSSFANDILLQQNMGDPQSLAQCFISSHYVGMAYNGEEVDGRFTLTFSNSIPNLTSLLEKIEQAKHSGLKIFPFQKDVVAKFSGDMAFTTDNLVIALQVGENELMNKTAMDLIQFIDLNCREFNIQD